MAVARGKKVRNVEINLHAPAQVREMIDCAARLLGTSRSQFMLDSARKCAVDVLLDQRFFLLDEKLCAVLSESLRARRETIESEFKMRLGLLRLIECRGRA